MSTLTTTYGLLFGEIVVVRITATNVNGDSVPSIPNVSGASIKQKPVIMSQPERGALTSQTQISVTWTALTSNADIGNSAILSYNLEWDANTNQGTWYHL